MRTLSRRANLPLCSESVLVPFDSRALLLMCGLLLLYLDLAVGDWTWSWIFPFFWAICWSCCQICELQTSPEQACSTSRGLSYRARCKQQEAFSRSHCHCTNGTLVPLNLKPLTRWIIWSVTWGCSLAWSIHRVNQVCFKWLVTEHVNTLVLIMHHDQRLSVCLSQEQFKILPFEALHNS